MTARQRLRAAIVLATALAIAGAFAFTSWGEALETRLADARLRLLAPPGAADAVVVVAIDEAALAEIGPWPWPRAVTAEFLRRLLGHAPAVVGLDIVFVPQGGGGEAGALAGAIRDSAVPVVIGQLMLPTAPEGDPGGGRLSIPAHAGFPVLAQAILAPEADLAAVAAVGHINSRLSQDGIVRHLQPVICTERGCSPSLGLGMLLEFLGVRGADSLRLEFDRRRWILALPGSPRPLLDLGTEARVEIPWRAPSPHRYVSARDVWLGTAPPDLLAEKFVLVGGIALGLGDRVATPVAPHLPGVEAHARLIAAWLAGETVSRGPLAWAWPAVALLVQFVLFWAASRRLLLLWAAGAAALISWLALITVAYRHQIDLPLLLPSLFPLLSLFALTLWRVNEERLHLGQRIRQFLPRPLAESLIRHHLLPAPERAWSTVLYADLVDYTRFSVTHTPEQVAHWGNTGVDLVIRHIEATGGQVDNIAGDGLLAYWRGEDSRTQAAQALTCLRGIASGLPVANRSLAAQGFEPLRIGLGLHAGELVAGLFGEQHLRYTVLGEVANLAHRIERETRLVKLSPLVSPVIAELTDFAGLREIRLERPIGPLTTLFHPAGESTL